MKGFVEVKKGEILQVAGATNSKIYDVQSGLLRSYTIDEKGKEHIFMFAPEGWIMADNGHPEGLTDLYIDALEDSKLIVLEKLSSEEILDARPLLRRISVLQNRVLMLMSSSGIERYEHFVKTYPDILQRVPQRMIASYLGITPEALSKVKNERLKSG